MKIKKLRSGFMLPVMAGMLTFGLTQCKLYEDPMSSEELVSAALPADDAIPGEVFQGKVAAVGDAISQGQLVTDGKLVNWDQAVGQGRIPVLIELTDDISDYRIPGGSHAQIAVYSEHATPFAILRQVLIRMTSWENYLFLDMH